MAKKTTSYNITEVNGKIKRVTTNTRIVQESRLQKSRRIASENSTLFRFALSGTIVMLFFGLFLLIGTTDFYNDNQQQLNWIDDNGQFIENSYNLSVTITNETPINELNNLTLNEVFIDNNDWIYNLQEGNLTDLGDEYQITTTSTFSRFLNNVINTHNYFISFNLKITQPLDALWILSSFDAGLYQLPQYVDEYHEYVLKIYADGTELNAPYFFDSQFVSQFIYLIKNPFLIDLTFLGIDNLTQNQLKFYFDLWKQNNERSIETYNQLGNIPITNLENMNTVLFKPAIEIVGGMTDTANTAIGFTLQAWNFVGDIWKRIWGVE
jgi:hypothetical protein